MSRWLSESKEMFKGQVFPEKTLAEIDEREKSVYNISEMKADVKRLNKSLDISANSNIPNYNKKAEKKLLAKLPKDWKFCNWLDYVGK